MYNEHETLQKALRELVKRECYWLKQKIASFQGKKYILFPAGPTAQRFYYTLKSDFGIEAEFFVDNNPSLEGKTLCGKPVMSFKTAFNGEEGNNYMILITTAFKYYREIALQLDNVGIYSYMSGMAYYIARNWERYATVCNMFEDEASKCAYWAAIYDLLTLNNEFIQYNENHYFALKDFAHSYYDNEIVVDAGAYDGNTTEEFVKRMPGKTKFYAFEPFDKIRTILEKRVSRLKVEYPLEEDDIVIIAGGVGAVTKKVRSKETSKMLTINDHGDLESSIYSLDDYFKDKQAFTILKADVEGAEMDMLYGAENMIRQNKPKMALSIYHYVDDFILIPEYVHRIVPEYRLFVRNHMIDYQDTVLYCII